MTDFGVVDDSVAICRGVMYGLVPNLRLVDLTHQVTPFSILDGARFLYGASPYYSAGTVFVTVVDPGVGSTRKAVVVKTKLAQYFVLPDNGLITLVAARDGLESAREITNRDWMIGARLSSTFHGRDIFSPVAAHIVRAVVTSSAMPAIGVDVTVDGRFVGGTMRVLSGALTGLRARIGNVGVGRVDLAEALRRELAAGDRIELEEGCDKRFATCADRFANAANFRGEPHLPGNDLLTRYPGG